MKPFASAESARPAKQPAGRVLILGARAPACLEWARAFAASGWQVQVADSLHQPVSRYSRAASSCHHLPEPRHDLAAWWAALARLVQAQRIDVILPTCEEVFYLGHGVEHLSPLPCRVLTLPLSRLHPLHHKYRFACLTAGWPAAAPETRLLDTLSAVRALSATSGEWVCKPAYSRFASRTLIRPAPAQLARIQPTASQPWVAQRFVAGREHCSYSLLVDGRLTAHACYHPRYRVGRGSGIYFLPTDPAPIRAFVTRFGQETGYSGQVAFDFIECADGTCHVLECNPRATSGVHLFDDQPQALVAALLGQTDSLPAVPVLVPAPVPRMVALAMLLFAAPRHLFRPEFWQDFAAARDVICRHGDTGPLVAQVPGLLEIAGRAVRRRSGLLAAATADIEWDGQDLGEKPCA